MTHDTSENTFSAAQFKRSVDGSASGSTYAAWFFGRVRELTESIEERLNNALEFKVENVAAEIQGCAADMAVLLTLLHQVGEHAKNLAAYKASIQNARLRIQGTLQANRDYIDAATGVRSEDDDNA